MLKLERLGLDLLPRRLTRTIVIDIVFSTASALARSAFTLEIDMIKPPTTLTRRSVFVPAPGWLLLQRQPG